ncbi:hypothetical protein EJ03DRAFT_342214 [Teratosphaeria nubilosa]|uniref:PQ loop repeat protein n=1 Tax=Teratosphaeria nubilosa TaxID=161662 RepID=A0A6G1LEZ1_9PEZI|nr:hypothetical protein EJ03DRAFT_342214 [Teratosphaeria nubilosa]
MAREIPEDCRKLNELSIPQFLISCALMVWLLLCYLPQWHRIVSRRSAEGLSTLYILLGSLSGVCAIGNIMMLPSSAIDIGCCRTNNTFACISGLLGILQVTFGISCFWVVLFMYVYYSEQEAEAEIRGRRHSVSGPDETFQRARQGWIVLMIACGFALGILLVSALILHWFPSASQAWANLLGVCVAAFACVQWIPQVATTWRLGHLGSLSALGLCLQVPYAWAFGISMLVRVGFAGWSAWVVYFIVGAMQLVIISFAIIFAIRDKHKPKEEQNDETRQPTETSRLLEY